ncbi:hypothetical protein L2E82_30109 [Cichorium intybus]|uniref:Uncharacterized protein n=1 Tax=Cichorium intybus TaxID=13427 RepID=A0ACB9CZW9_CICIN|nr:hypothetical protein L2E82_30109 [Cichorium intybus]
MASPASQIPPRTIVRSRKHPILKRNWADLSKINPLQREIPYLINIQVAKAARSAGVPVILDAGGMDSLIPVE